MIESSIVLGSESHTFEYNRPGGQGRLRVGGASIYNRIPASYMYKLEENNLNTGCSHTFNNLDFMFQHMVLIFLIMSYAGTNCQSRVFIPQCLFTQSKAHMGLLVCIWGNGRIAFCPEMIRLISGLSCH